MRKNIYTEQELENICFGAKIFGKKIHQDSLGNYYKWGVFTVLFGNDFRMVESQGYKWYLNGFIVRECHPAEKI